MTLLHLWRCLTVSLESPLSGAPDQGTDPMPPWPKIGTDPLPPWPK